MSSPDIPPLSANQAILFFRGAFASSTCTTTKIWGGGTLAHPPPGPQARGVGGSLPGPQPGGSGRARWPPFPRGSAEAAGPNQGGRQGGATNGDSAAELPGHPAFASPTCSAGWVPTHGASEAEHCGKQVSGIPSDCFPVHRLTYHPLQGDQDCPRPFFPPPLFFLALLWPPEYTQSLSLSLPLQEPEGL